MVMKPCLTCGEPTDSTRCRECHRAQPRKPRSHTHMNPARWKNLSARLRRLQPFCIDCGTGERLQADHIIPVSERPDLAYAVENLAVRCRSCNGAKSGRPPTPQERADVETRIATAKARRVRLTTTHGEYPTPVPLSAAGEAGKRLHTRGHR